MIFEEMFHSLDNPKIYQKTPKKVVTAKIGEIAIFCISTIFRKILFKTLYSLCEFEAVN